MNNQKITTKNDFLLNRIKFLKEIITKTMLSCQKYKLSDILGTNEVNVCINTLETLFKDIQQEDQKINQTKKQGKKTGRKERKMTRRQESRAMQTCKDRQSCRKARSRKARKH